MDPWSAYLRAAATSLVWIGLDALIHWIDLRLSLRRLRIRRQQQSDKEDEA